MVSLMGAHEEYTNLCSPYFADAFVPSVGAGHAEGSEGIERPLLLCDFAGSLVYVGIRKGDVGACGLGLEIVALYQVIHRFVGIVTQIRTVESPFLGFPAFLGKTIKRAL